MGAYQEKLPKFQVLRFQLKLKRTRKWGELKKKKKKRKPSNFKLKTRLFE